MYFFCLYSVSLLFYSVLVFFSYAFFLWSYPILSNVIVIYYYPPLPLPSSSFLLLPIPTLLLPRDAYTLCPYHSLPLTLTTHHCPLPPCYHCPAPIIYHLPPPLPGRSATRSPTTQHRQHPLQSHPGPPARPRAHDYRNAPGLGIINQILAFSGSRLFLCSTSALYWSTFLE